MAKVKYAVSSPLAASSVSGRQAERIAVASKNECIISVGSNVRPRFYIPCAREILAAECELAAASRPIETAADGAGWQGTFTNGAFVVRTSLEPAAFKRYLRGVEDRLGRSRTSAGICTVDLDMIVWNGKVIDQDYFAKLYVSGPVDEVAALLAIDLRKAVG